MENTLDGINIKAVVFNVFFDGRKIMSYQKAASIDCIRTGAVREVLKLDSGSSGCRHLGRS